jgi:hypothetical protein
MVPIESTWWVFSVRFIRIVARFRCMVGTPGVDLWTPSQRIADGGESSEGLASFLLACKSYLTFPTREEVLMNRLSTLSSLTVLTILQGCVVSHGDTSRHLESNHVDGDDMNPVAETTLTNSMSPISLCVDAGGCVKSRRVAHGTELGSDKDAPVVEGHPLTSVVVTQCNLVVAVYMTMPDGRFLRFDQKANVSAEELVTMAYTASHSERVEVSCQGEGLVAYEKHEPI